MNGSNKVTWKLTFNYYLLYYLLSLSFTSFIYTGVPPLRIKDYALLQKEVWNSHPCQWEQDLMNENLDE